MTYRLAPQHPCPAGAEDVGRAVEWVACNAKEFGADAGAIFVMGQSAGAVHVANYLVDAQFHRSAGRGLAGALLISGLYDIAAVDRSQFQRAYYGDDDSKWGQYSSIAGLAATDLPFLATVSELDPEDFQRQAAALVAATLATRKEYPRMLFLQGHNHLSSVLQVGSREDCLGPEIASFIDGVHSAPR
jgi:triacylglycerol lipase